MRQQCENGSLNGKLTHRLERVFFLSCERGAAAAEFALVLPLFLLFLFGTAQYGFMLYTYNNMQQAAREGVRALAVEDATATDAETIAENQLVGWASGATVAAEDTDTTGTDYVNVEISMASSDAGFFNFLPAPETLVATAVMRKEGT